MKIVGVAPIKNEGPFIDSFASSLSKVCDKIIIIDDNSTDNSLKLLQKYKKIDVISANSEEGWGSKRANLFNLARDYSASHIVSLDADEAFTANAIQNFDKIITSLKKGERCTMHWLPMWKSLYNYRDDNSVWSNSYKDFIIHDDGKINYSGNWIHEPRLPIVNKTKQIPTNEGAVFHFQFSSWDAFQIKQSWYRCLERVRNPQKHIADINRTYSITLEDNQSRVTEAPKEWYNNVELPKVEEIYKNCNWRLKEIKDWINIYGLQFFKDLEIWHVNEIKKIINE